MASKTLTPQRAESLLPANRAKIKATKETLAALYAERLEAFEVLTDAETMTQAEMAALAGVTPMAVAQQLWKARHANGE